MCGKCIFEAKFLEFTQPIAPRKKKVRKGIPKKSNDEQLVWAEIAKCLMELVEKIGTNNDDDQSIGIKGTSTGDTIQFDGFVNDFSNMRIKWKRRDEG